MIRKQETFENYIFDLNLIDPLILEIYIGNQAHIIYYTEYLRNKNSRYHYTPRFHIRCLR